MGVIAKHRSRARSADRAFESVLNGLGFALFGRKTKNVAGAQESGDGEGEGVRRHRFEAGEMAFLDLLPFACVIELHQLDVIGVFKVGDMWVIEGEVTVFAYAEAAEVNGLCLKKAGVTTAFVEGKVAIAGEIVESAWLDEGFDAFAHVFAEACGVVGLNAEVFVHVKKRD